MKFSLAWRGVWTWVKRGLIVFVVIVIPVAWAIPAWHGYRSRALISEALADGGAMRSRVAEFYEKNRRLPQPADATGLQLAGSDLKRARSVAWDAPGRRIVITVSEPESLAGKRIALNAEERDGRLDWSCRAIDLEGKYLPGACR